METVNTLDIGGTQWEIRDEEARNKIAVLEENDIIKDIDDINITLKSDYKAKSAIIDNHYKIGKIHFMGISLQDVSGPNIGTTSTANLGSINIHPRKYTTFLLYDYTSGAVLRCFINKDGIINIGESTGVVQGYNFCLGELIFAEE